MRSRAESELAPPLSTSPKVPCILDNSVTERNDALLVFVLTLCTAVLLDG